MGGASSTSWRVRVLGNQNLGLLIWSWKSNRKMDRLIDQRARFQARMTPENQSYSNALTDDPSEHKHRR
jgi:hypothetical protein